MVFSRFLKGFRDYIIVSESALNYPDIAAIGKVAADGAGWREAS